MVFLIFFQVNFSVVQNNASEKNKAPIDPWHWDSVAYTGVLLLNDMTGKLFTPNLTHSSNKEVFSSNRISGWRTGTDEDGQAKGPSRVGCR